MTTYIYLISGIAFISGLISGAIMNYVSKKAFYFNGKYHYSSHWHGIKDVKFIVEKVEKVSDTDDFPIGEYTIYCTFFNKKNNKDFHYNHFVFYDKMNKYNVGDELTLNKIEHPKLSKDTYERCMDSIR